MIRDIQPDDRAVFLSMVSSFYASSAVTHAVDPRNFETTFNAAIDKSPFMRGFIIEDEDRPVGYALLSFTYSNEVGGLVVLVEELYISEFCRGKGLGGGFFGFLEQEYPSARRFRLEVREDNIKAIDLYGKLGYEFLEYRQMAKDKTGCAEQ